MPSIGLAGKFRSHQNYLGAFSHLAGFPPHPGNGREVLREMSENVMTAFPRTGSSRPYDKRELAACLNRAWGTELILATSSAFDRDDDFVRIANSWSCVQTYYVGYSATQALVVANGDQKAGHSRTRDQWIFNWSRRGDGVVPFSFAADHGSVLDRDPKAYLHGPGRNVYVGIHSWSTLTKSNAWDLAAVALRTTREDAVESKLREARERKIKQRKRDWQVAETERIEKGMAARSAPTFKTAQLSQAEKDDCENGVRPHGLLDYLHRLRIKANYEDADMFTEGPEDGSSSILVATSMVRIATAIMIAHETRIAQLLGTAAIMDLARAWVLKNAPTGSTGIGLRLPILEQVLS